MGESRPEPGIVRQLWQTPEAQLAVRGGFLNALWEFGHSRFYADHDGSWSYLAWTRLHCTAGDVLILLAAFELVSLVFGTRAWVATRRRVASAMFVGIGFGYTVFSEWWNTTVRGAWQYADSMPQLLGVGLLPSAQWLVIPSLILWQLRSATQARCGTPES